MILLYSVMEQSQYVPTYYSLYILQLLSFLQLLLALNPLICSTFPFVSTFIHMYSSVSSSQKIVLLHSPTFLFLPQSFTFPSIQQMFDDILLSHKSCDMVTVTAYVLGLMTDYCEHNKQILTKQESIPSLTLASCNSLWLHQ